MKARVCGSVSRCWYTADSDLRSAARSAGGGHEPGAHRAGSPDVGGVAAGCQSHRIPCGTAGCLPEPGALLGGERREPPGAGDQHVELGPQGHVRGHVRRPGGEPCQAHVTAEVQLESLDLAAAQSAAADRAEGHHRGGAQGPDRLLLDLRPQGAERDAAPVRRGEQRAPGADGQPQPFPEHPQAGHVHAGEPGEHPARHGAAEHGVLQRVAVDQHRRRQRPKVSHSDGVEDPASRPAQIHRPGCGGAHYLGLGVRRPITPLAGDLDLESPP